MHTPERFTGPLASLWRIDGPRLAHDLLRDVSDPLPVPPATDRSTWSALDAPTLADIGARATASLAAPWPVPLQSDYSRRWREGDRDTYEQAVFARQSRLSRAVVMAAATLEDQWLDEVADGVTLLCEQSSWCWPAHDDTHAVHGAVVPTVTDPFLDLGAGEVVGQLAWLDHVLAAPLDERYPGLRTRIRHEADARVLTPFLRRRDWHWLGLDGDVHNWNPWIHGNVLVAALALEDDADRRAQIVDLVIEGIDRYVAGLPDDGAVDEGYSYWWNGACRAIEALDVLRHATSGALDATSIPALRATVAFPHRMHLSDGWYLNVADGPARPSQAQPWHALHRAARAVQDEQAAAHAATHRVVDGPVADEAAGLGRLLRALVDTAWHDAAPIGSPLPRDVWLPSTQVLIARHEGGSPRGLTLAAKGGHNGEHHNHNDVGELVVALNGVPVIVDAGRPTYTAATFGPDRYAIWTMQSTWHNVPEVRGSAQAPGTTYAARDLTVQQDEAGAVLRMDLAAAYPRDDISRWWRTCRLDRAAARVTVTDEWELDGASRPSGESDDATSVRLLLAGTVRTSPGRAEIDALDGAGTAVVAWEPAVPCAVTRRELDDPMLADVWGNDLTLLTLDVTGIGATGSLQLTVEER
ncbi:MAG: heparinase II/III domain-containing protein [Cellulomonas sp.]